MKRFYIIALLSVASIAVAAQTKAKPKTTGLKKSVAVKTTIRYNPDLKTLADSASYAIGQNMAQSITKDLKNLNKEAFLNAIKTVFNSQTPMFKEDELQLICLVLNLVDIFCD